MLSSIVKAVMGSNASKKAASIQDQAAQRAADASLAQYEQTRKDLEPYRTAGTQSLTRLSDLMGTSGNATAEGYGSLGRGFSMADFEKDPGYQFRFDEGMKALERTQAAKGGLFSGGAMRESQRYGQGLASQEFNSAFDRFNTSQNNVFNRLNSLTSSGQNAATQTGNFGANATNQANNARMSGAAARAGGVVGSANSWISGISDIEQSMQRAMGMPGGSQQIQWGTGLNRVGGNMNNPDNWNWK